VSTLALIGEIMIASSGWLALIGMVLLQRRQRNRRVREMYDSIAIHDEVTKVGLTPR